MTRDELESRLVRKGIRPDAYGLAATQNDEVYCLEEAGTGWVVYYRERGMRRDEHLFSTEGEACRYILDLILRDPTARIQETP